MDVQKGRAIRLKTLDLSRAKKDSDSIAKAMEVAGFVGNENEFFVPATLLEFGGRTVGQRFTLHHKLGVHEIPGTFAPIGTHVEFTGAIIEDIGGGVLGIMNCFSILDGEYKGKTMRFAPGSSAEWSLKEG